MADPPLKRGRTANLTPEDLFSPQLKSNERLIWTGQPNEAAFNARCLQLPSCVLIFFGALFVLLAGLAIYMGLSRLSGWLEFVLVVVGIFASFPGLLHLIRQHHVSPASMFFGLTNHRLLFAGPGEEELGVVAYDYGRVRSCHIIYDKFSRAQGARIGTIQFHIGIITAINTSFEYIDNPEAVKAIVEQQIEEARRSFCN
jgi:hypothetical protein